MRDFLAPVNEQGIEPFCAEEFSQCDAEAVAELLDVVAPRILAFPQQDALDGGLGDAGDFAHFVGGDIIFLAELADAVGDCFLCVHDGASLCYFR